MDGFEEERRPFFLRVRRAEAETLARIFSPLMIRVRF